MNTLSILLIGSGGREHALAWKLAQSPRVEKIYAAQGNGGTAVTPKTTNIPIAATEIENLLQFAVEKQIGLTVVGPEDPLAAGIADRFQAAGLKIFGPSKAAAQLEASKSFSKQFMIEANIPTAVHASFTNYEAARAYAAAQPHPLVVKAAGLAAGKGVFVCDTTADALDALQKIMQDAVFGGAGAEVVVEERLSGAEVSLLAFCDGKTAVPLIPVRDHKRAYDNDQGPNTGGMGVFTPPSDVDTATVNWIMENVVNRAVGAMAARGTPYVGVLYAGIMLTADGPKTLEFNCRFGDPETQVALPMLESDLAEILLACVDGRLAPNLVKARDGACAAVVMAAPGYPAAYPKNLPIAGVDEAQSAAETVVFHAGTKTDNGRLFSSGGRVLAVSAWADRLETAVARAYEGVAKINFEGAHYRSDIGRKPKTKSAYQKAGVNIAAGHEATRLMKTAVQATFTPDVLSDVGAFGGLFNAAAFGAMDAPILVASTDGVGTKTKVAAALGRWDSIGHDIVNHCLNDILVQGARPLFFLDYVASAALDPQQIAQIVSGAARACQAVGCALLGGETAEMPGVYCDGAVDLVGTVVGVVERGKLIDGSRIEAGNALLALPSSGLHTNGFTLARSVLAGEEWTNHRPDLGESIGDALLKPHRSYLREIEALWSAGVDVRGLAHITGGGLIDNPPRIFPDGLGAVLRRGDWSEPPIFGLMQRLGSISDADMFHAFNMGVGMLVVIPAAQVTLALQTLRGDGVLVGEMIAAEKGVSIQ